MQVSNQSINYDNLNSSKRRQHLSCKIAFNQASNSALNQTKEEQKKSLSIFQLLDIVGVTLGLGAMGGYLLMQHKRPQAEKIVEKLSKQLKKTENLIAGLEEKSNNNKTKSGLGFKAGKLFNKWAEQSEELFNNIVYGVGSLIIAPLVISLDPLGNKKKKASKEDKFLVILQRYVSFGALFAMQLTVDRFLDGLVPKFVKKNAFEKNYKDKNDKLILDNIKFNSTPHKEHFVKEMEKLGQTKEQVDELFKLGDFKTIQEQLKKVIKPENFEIMSKKLDKYFKAKGREKLLTQTLVIVTNVFFSIPVGGSILNVLYGKSVKAINNSKNKTNEKTKKSGEVSFKGKSLNELKEASALLKESISKIKNTIPEEKESKIMNSVKNILAKFADSNIFKKIGDSDNINTLTYLLVVGNAAKEAMRTFIFTGQSFTNEDLPPDKRKFVGGYNLAIGVVSTILSLGVGLAMVKGQKKMIEAIIGGDKSKNLPGYAKAFAGMRFILPMIMQTILVKRVIAPAIAVPFAGKMTTYLEERENNSIKQNDNISIKPDEGFYKGMEEWMRRRS